MPPRGSPRRDLFVQEYLVDLNATQAAIRAGYSPRTARSIGAENLTKPDIQAAIQTAMDERAKRVGMTAEEVLREIKAIGMSDVRHYEFSDGPDPLVLAENAPDIAMRAVSSVKRKVRKIPQKDGLLIEVEEIEFKLWDKPSALRMAGQHLRLYGDEGDGGGDGSVLVFLLPVQALNAQDWAEKVAARKAGEIVVPKKVAAGGKK